MSSARRVAANQQNAQKSTGPRTTEGKAHSRRNALKHGLAGEGDVLPVADEALFAERLHLWTIDARPQGDIEQYLVASAALASVRLDRCAHHEFAVMTRKRRRATQRWETRQARKLNKLLDQWDKEPDETLAHLQESILGCDWLVDRWDELDQALSSSDGWTGDHAALALRLLGVPAEMRDDDDPAITALRAAVQAPANQADQPAHSQSIETLATLIAEEIDRLEDLREDLWIEQDGPSLAEAINIATVDNTPAAERLRRYESASARDLHRCLARLADIKKEKRQARRREEQYPEAPPGYYDAPERDEPAAKYAATASNAPAEGVPSPSPDEQRNEPSAAYRAWPPTTSSGDWSWAHLTPEENAARLARLAIPLEVINSPDDPRPDIPPAPSGAPSEPCS